MSSANRGRRIPWYFGRTVHIPGRVYAYRAVAMLLLMTSVWAWRNVVGTWCVLISALALIPTAILNGHHNRQVAVRA